MSANRDTDVRRKTGFTSGIVGLGGAASGTSGGSKQAAQTTQTAEEYLQQTEDELNNRVDHGITGLADGFMDLIKLASVRSQLWQRHQG